MDQILHIVKKDIRRHWPEILLSLALLALYTNRALHPWTNLLDSYSLPSSFFFFFVTGEYIAPLFYRATAINPAPRAAISEPPIPA